MSLSVLDYYFSLLHDISVNFKYSFYHLSNFLWRFRYTKKFIKFFAIYSTASISGRLNNVCQYVLALGVWTHDFGYLAIEAGIQ